MRLFIINFMPCVCVKALYDWNVTKTSSCAHFNVTREYIILVVHPALALILLECRRVKLSSYTVSSCVLRTRLCELPPLPDNA